MSNYNTLLVSEEKLKAYTAINWNVSPDDLRPFMLQSQDIWLQNYLGTSLYKEIKRQVNSNTLTTANRYLLDNFIGPMLCNYSLYHALPFLKYKLMNKSVLAPEGESAPGASLDEVKFLQAEVLNVAEVYVKRMVEYMRQNPSDYPLYIAPTPLDGQLPDRRNPYFGGLVVPFRRRKYYYYDENGCDECYDRNSPTAT